MGASTLQRLAILWIIALGWICPPLKAAPWTVSGSLMSADSRPLPEARVQLYRQADNYTRLLRLFDPSTLAVPYAETTTDAQGRYRLQVDTTAVWRLVVEVPGRVPMPFVLLPLTSDRELAPITLPSDAGLEVQVVDGHGRPLAGAMVFAQCAEARWWRSRVGDGWGPPDRFYRTDGVGRVVVPRAAGEPLRLVALAPGSHSPVELQVAAEDSSTRRTWQLAQGSPKQLNLTVLEADGKPVAEALIAWGDLALPAGTTDTSGRLALRGSAAGEQTLHVFAADGRYVRRSLDPADDGFGSMKTVALPTAPPLHGRLVDVDDRRPLAGALVWSGADPGRFTRTSADGRFSLATSGAPRFWVQGEAAGYLPLLQRSQPTDEGWLSPILALTPSATLSGHVVDSHGEPLSNVVLELAAEDPRALPVAYRSDRRQGRAHSDGAGRFTLPRLHPSATYRLEVRRLGYSTATLGIPRPQPTEPLRIALATARPAFGRVVDIDERPVAGATVTLVDASHPERSMAPVETNGEGFFRVPELPAQRLHLEVVKRGYPPVRVRALPPVVVAEEGGDLASSAVADPPVDLGVVVLRPGLALEGRVVDGDGEPIGNADITALPAAEDAVGSLANRTLSLRPVSSNDNGAFRFAGLVDGQRVFLRVEHPEYSSYTVEGVEIPAEQKVIVVLSKGSRIRGRIEGVDGQPIVGAKVDLLGAGRPAGTLGVQDPGDENSQEVVSDGEGQFEFLGVIPGRVRLRAVMEEFMPTESSVVDVGQGATVEDVVLVLQRGRVLRGSVTNGDGNPIAEARLALEHAVAVSDVEGAFRLAGLPPGSQVLEVRHAEYNRTTRDVLLDDAETRIDLVLRGGMAVRGRVLDPSQEPIAGAAVLFQLRARRDHHDYRAMSDEDGRFELPSMAHGHYRVSAQAPGFARAELAGGWEVGDESTGEVVLRLAPGTEVVGAVLGLDFAELSEVEVMAQGPAGTIPAVVDYEGNFQLRDLGPGVWVLRARLDGGRREAERRVAIAPDVERLRRDIEFGGGLTLSGQVLFGGEPMARTWIALRSLESDLQREVTSDYQGRFRLLDLPAASYRLSVSNARHTVVHNEELTLVQDRDLLVELEAAEVRGVVQRSDGGGPLDEAMIFLQQMYGADKDEPGSLITVATDAAGRFHLARVSEGDYRLRVEKPGFGPWKHAFRVTSGVDVEPLVIELDETAPLNLRVRLADGGVPPWVDVSLFDGGRSHVVSSRQTVDRDGGSTFPSLPEGTWQVSVDAPGATAAWRTFTIPSAEAVEVVLRPASNVRVEVAALAESTRRATVTVTDDGGRPFGRAEAGGRWVKQWPLVRGSALVEGLPEGVWRLQVLASDGQHWQGTATTVSGRTVVVGLP